MRKLYTRNDCDVGLFLVLTRSHSGVWTVNQRLYPDYPTAESEVRGMLRQDSKSQGYIAQIAGQFRGVVEVHEVRELEGQ